MGTAAVISVLDWVVPILLGQQAVQMASNINNPADAQPSWFGQGATGATETLRALGGLPPLGGEQPSQYDPLELDPLAALEPSAPDMPRGTRRGRNPQGKAGWADPLFDFPQAGIGKMGGWSSPSAPSSPSGPALTNQPKMDIDALLKLMEQGNKVRRI